MTINDLAALEPMLHFQIAAGFDGLMRRVSGVSILEEDGLHIPGGNFAPGDFLLTDFLFVRGDSKQIFEAVKCLTEWDAAGLAIKTTYISALDQEIRDYADLNQFPIFLFDAIPITDVFLYIYNRINGQKQIDRSESLLRQMFASPISGAVILQNVLEINPLFQNDYYCAYLTPKVPSAAIAAQEGQCSIPNQRYSSLVRYEKGWFLLTSFPKDVDIPDQTSHFRMLLAQYRLEPLHFFCGLSCFYHDLTQFDLCLTEAICASKLAKKEDRLMLHYNQLGVYQFLLPKVNSRSVLKQFQTTYSILEAYDKKYNSNLLETLRIYIKCEGKIAQTAQMLFLHVNTVRYRLDKLRELLGPEDFFVQAYLFIKIADFLGK